MVILRRKRFSDDEREEAIRILKEVEHDLDMVTRMPRIQKPDVQKPLNKLYYLDELLYRI